MSEPQTKTTNQVLTDIVKEGIQEGIKKGIEGVTNPLSIVSTAFTIVQICQTLNDDYIKYKNLSNRIYTLAKSVNKHYENKSNIPEIIVKFYKFTLKFKKLVEKSSKRNFMKRMWALKRNNDTFRAYEEEFEYIMKQFQIETYNNTHDLVEEVKKLRLENEREKEKIRLLEKQKENDYYNKTLNNDQELYKAMLTKKTDNNGTTVIDEFKKDEYGCTVQTINMIEENRFSDDPQIKNYANKMLGYMHRNSKIAQQIKKLPSWYINEVNIETSDDIESRIGAGSYSYVQKGYYNGAIVAKKTFDILSSEYQKMVTNNNDNKNLYMREIEIWSKIKSHPFILQFYGACHVSEYPFIVSEFCSEGTVKSYVNRSGVTTNKKLQIMHDIAIGIYHLHNSKIIHGDLKSDNILITENGTPKICDFGLSVYLSNKPEDKLISTCNITEAVRWKAPELFKGYKLPKPNIIGKISQYTDIFSLGRLYYEIIAQQNPFYEVLYNDEVERRVVNGDFPSRVYSNSSSKNSKNALYSDDMWEILERTWAYDPFERITLLSIAGILDQLKTLGKDEPVVKTREFNKPTEVDSKPSYQPPQTSPPVYTPPISTPGDYYANSSPTVGMPTISMPTVGAPSYSNIPPYMPPIGMPAYNMPPVNMPPYGNNGYGINDYPRYDSYDQYKFNNVNGNGSFMMNNMNPSANQSPIHELRKSVSNANLGSMSNSNSDQVVHELRKTVSNMNFKERSNSLNSAESEPKKASRFNSLEERSPKTSRSSSRKTVRW